MRLTLSTLALCVISTTAHLEINLVAGPDLKISAADESRGGDKSIILGRTSVTEGNQNGRDPNVPEVGAVCHGHPMLAGDKLATLTAGGEFEWGIAKEKVGSGHDGGHCSWWVSDGTDQTTWFKFMDDLDCTNFTNYGTQPGKITVKKNLPLSCEDACTIMWLWAPLHAAECEIYSNCFDVKIEGVQGGIESGSYPKKNPPFECIRVNPETHKTSSFGKFINVGSNGIISFETVVDGDQDCYQYTVRQGDNLQEMLAKFDFDADDLYSRNKKIMASKDALPAVGTKLTIAGCEAKAPKPDSLANTAGSICLSSLITLGAIASLF